MIFCATILSHLGPPTQWSFESVRKGQINMFLPFTCWASVSKLPSSHSSGEYNFLYAASGNKHCLTIISIILFKNCLLLTAGSESDFLKCLFSKLIHGIVMEAEVWKAATSITIYNMIHKQIVTCYWGTTWYFIDWSLISSLCINLNYRLWCR